MEVSITWRLDKIQDFLHGFQKNHSQLRPNHLYSIKSAMAAIKFLRAAVSYAERIDRDEDMPSSSSSLSSDMEDILQSLENIISADFGEADFESDYGHYWQFWGRDINLWSQVGNFSKKLMEAPHPSIADGFVFDQFAA